MQEVCRPRHRGTARALQMCTRPHPHMSPLRHSVARHPRSVPLRTLLRHSMTVLGVRHLRRTPLLLLRSTSLLRDTPQRARDTLRLHHPSLRPPLATARSRLRSARLPLAILLQARRSVRLPRDIHQLPQPKCRQLRRSTLLHLPPRHHRPNTLLPRPPIPQLLRLTPLRRLRIARRHPSGRLRALRKRSRRTEAPAASTRTALHLRGTEGPRELPSTSMFFTSQLPVDFSICYTQHPSPISSSDHACL